MSRSQTILASVAIAVAVAIIGCCDDDACCRADAVAYDIVASEPRFVVSSADRGATREFEQDIHLGSDMREARLLSFGGLDEAAAYDLPAGIFDFDPAAPPETAPFVGQFRADAAS